MQKGKSFLMKNKGTCQQNLKESIWDGTGDCSQSNREALRNAGSKPHLAVISIGKYRVRDRQVI